MIIVHSFDLTNHAIKSLWFPLSNFLICLYTVFYNAAAILIMRKWLAYCMKVDCRLTVLPTSKVREHTEASITWLFSTYSLNEVSFYIQLPAQSVSMNVKISLIFQAIRYSRGFEQIRYGTAVMWQLASS